MQMDITVGIIICARDMEKYITQCLTACLHNATLRTELHIINDGSTDGTGQAIEAFSNRYASQTVSFSLYQTEGCGPGAARNLALRQINTDIVAFVDADDLINRSTLDTLAMQMMQHGADVGLPAIVTFSERTGVIRDFDPVRQRLLTTLTPGNGAVTLTTLMQTPGLAGIETSMCMKVFRGSFLRQHTINFGEGYFCEDVFPSLISLCKAQQILLVSQRYYYYRLDRPGQRTIQISASSAQLLNSINDLMDHADFTSQSIAVRAALMATLARMVPWAWSLLPWPLRADFTGRAESLFRRQPGQILHMAVRQLPLSPAKLWLASLAWLPALPISSCQLLHWTSTSSARLRQLGAKARRVIGRLSPFRGTPQNSRQIIHALQVYTETGLIRDLRLLPKSSDSARAIAHQVFPDSTLTRRDERQEEVPVLCATCYTSQHYERALYVTGPQEILSAVYPRLAAQVQTSLIINPVTGTVATHYASAVEISVIVPVYGVAAYVGKCTDSLLAQTFNGRFEVLFIDDGSTDGSVEIIQQRIKGNANFRIINQPNAGAAAARNTGIRLARGQYICFVDGDDYVAGHYLQTLYDLITGHSASIAQAAFAYVDNATGKITANQDNLRVRQTAGHAIAQGTDVMRSVPGIWRRIYARDFLLSNNLFFNPQFRRHDDLPFNIRTLVRAGDIPVSHEVVYFYVIGRPGQDVSATDERMFIHFRLFDDVLKDDCIMALTGRRYRTFLKVMCSHHLWSFTRLEPAYRQHYLPGFAHQLFNSPGNLSPALRTLVLLPAFAGFRRMLLNLLVLSRCPASDSAITDLNFTSRFPDGPGDNAAN